MPSAIYTTVLGLVSRLNYSESEQLMQDILKMHSTSTHGTAKLIGELREKKYSEGFVCPHCGSNHVIRFGKFKGRQRYRCKDCPKSFSDLTNTPLARTRFPNKWIHRLYA